MRRSPHRTPAAVATPLWRTVILPAAATLAALLCAVPSRADTAGASIAPGDDVLQEVVVTAQKREQNLQNVGVSVTAFSGEDLRRMGVGNAMDIGSVVPSVQLNSASGGNISAPLTIRGVAQNDFSPQQESPNSIYIDDVYVSAPNAAAAPLFDVERIEALRGPQGTLYGRNSTGGLVNFITTRPSSTAGGYAELTTGEFNLVQFEGAYGGPLTDTLRARVAVYVKGNSGIFENHLAGQPDANTTHSRAVRLSVENLFLDKVSALLTISYLHDNDREGYYDHISTYYDPAAGGRAVPLPATLDAWGTGPGNDLVGYRSPYSGTEGQTIVGFLRRGILSPTLRLTADLGGATLTSITNYTDLKFNYDESCSGAPQVTCRDPIRQDLQQWSEELRLNGTSGPATWVGGLYALNINQHDRSAYSAPYFSGTPFAYDSFDLVHQNTTSLAGFGQLEYLFNPSWRGTLGLRVTNDRKSFSSATYLNEAGDFVSTDAVYNPPLLIAQFDQATVGDLAKQNNTGWSGKVQLDYLMSADGLLYASVSRGIKGAGFNSNVLGAADASKIPFRGEHMIAYELGEKLELLDHRVRINSSVFYYDYKDFQAFQFVGISPYVDNRDAHFSGGELEIDARPMRGLELRAAGAYLNTRVLDVQTAQIGIADQQASDAPRWSGSGQAQYAWQAGPGEASVRWSVDYVSGRYHSVDNTPAVFIHPSAGNNVRLGYAVGKWDLSAYCNNVFDRARQTGAYDLTSTAGYSTRTYMAPRWWGLTAHYGF
jgi:iron complex outermembrane receptor protein